MTFAVSIFAGDFEMSFLMLTNPVYTEDLFFLDKDSFGFAYVLFLRIEFAVFFGFYSLV